MTEAAGQTEFHSTRLRKELRLIDLIGMQILNIVGLYWVGTAGKLGPAHVMYWVPAALLFYVPSGIVVASLVKDMPLEGGLYQWAKQRFSPCMGFLVAMNIWLYNLLVVCKIGVVVADNLAYALGPAASWVSSSKPAIISMGIVTMVGLMFLAWRGLALGKWINNIGGCAVVFLFVAMIMVALPRWLHWDPTIPAGSASIAFALPAIGRARLLHPRERGHRESGGISIARQRRRHPLCAHLSGDVRNTADRTPREAFLGPALGRGLRVSDDPPLRRAVRRSHRRSAGPVAVQRQDHRRRCGLAGRGRRVLSACFARTRACPHLCMTLPEW
jgi:hypothetical protein